MGYRVAGLYDCQFLQEDAGAIVAVDLPWGKTVTPDVDTADLEWEGDGETLTLTRVTGFRVEIEQDAFTPDVKALLFGQTATTTGLPTGVAKQWANGGSAENAGVSVGFEGYVNLIDLDTGATKWGRFVVPLATLTPPAPPEFGSNAISTSTWNLSAIKTTKDIAGNTIPGAGTGVTWLFQELTAETAAHEVP